MATEHRWISTDGDWGNTASWSSGQVPGAGGVGTDSAIFDGTSVVSVTQNLNRLADNTLHKIVVYESYTGDIGSSGAPLRHELASSGNLYSRVIHRGTGQFYFYPSAGGFADVVVDSARGTETAAMILLDGTLSGLFVKRGFVSLSANVDVTDWLIIDGPTAKVTLAGTNNIATTSIIYEGSCVNSGDSLNSSAYIIIVLGGTWRQTGLMFDNNRIVVAPPGVFEYVPASLVTSSHNPSVVAGGLVDLSESFQDIEFDDLIITQGGNVRGTGSQVTQGGALSIDIDLREDYP